MGLAFGAKLEPLKKAAKTCQKALRQPQKKGKAAGHFSAGLRRAHTQKTQAVSRNDSDSSSHTSHVNGEKKSKMTSASAGTDFYRMFELEAEVKARDEHTHPCEDGEGRGHERPREVENLLPRVGQREVGRNQIHSLPKK
jgi:hypothetical protein